MSRINFANYKKQLHQGDRSEITVIKEYSNLPLVECYPSQLNQVFMNVLPLARLVQPTCTASDDN